LKNVSHESLKTEESYTEMKIRDTSRTSLSDCDATRKLKAKERSKQLVIKLKICWKVTNI